MRLMSFTGKESDICYKYALFLTQWTILWLLYFRLVDGEANLGFYKLILFLLLLWLRFSMISPPLPRTCLPKALKQLEFILELL